MRRSRLLIRAMSILAIITIGISAAARAADAPGKLPPAEGAAKEVLNQSPRHGEWADIPGPDGKPIRSYVVFPEVKDKAPVVVVIHEIYGLTDWIRSVTDQLAADGFIAIAPDLLSGTGKDGGGTDSYASRDDVTKAVRGLAQDKVTAQLNAVRAYGSKLPASTGKTATVGFCWGGGQSFNYAIAQPELSAAVVYYGTNPDPAQLAKVKAPVLGLYGSNDARVNTTVPPAQAAMKAASKTYEVHTFEGAGHGFLRQQDGNDANAKAAKEAWPATVKFIREHAK